MDRNSRLLDGDEVTEPGAFYQAPPRKADRSKQIITALFVAFIVIIVLGAIGTVIATVIVQYTRNRPVVTSNEYDYIIVGAGAAGCVLAARLTENPNVRVLLLEAGGPSQISTGGTDYASVSMRRDHERQRYYYSPITRVDVPLLWVTIPWNDGLGYNWPGLSERATLGRALGGGSAVNAMIYVRGIPQDFKSWGLKYWSWEDVLPLYMKSENNTGVDTKNDATYHSRSGPMHIDDRRYEDFPGKLFVESCWNRGHGNNPDFNGAARDGCGFYQFNNFEGIRDSTASAFLAPAMKRPNLFVRTYSAATKINFDGDRASGVNFVRVNPLPPLYNTNAEMQTAIAKKEVIVAAGAIHSPKLLLLSGIGPADELKQVNIPVKKDLPGVGKNLHDHSMTWVEWFFDDVFYPSAYTISKHLDAYAWNRNGIFAWSGLGGGGFIKTKPEMDRPDVQFTCFPKDLQSEIDQDTVAVNTTRKAAMVVTITLDTPKTKGYVSLASDDYKADPILGDTLEQQFRAGTNHPDDMASLVAGINALRNIKNTPPMSTRVGAEMNPGSQVNSTADVEDWIRKNIKRTDHWVGSCKMGNDADPMAVVDERLRVRGLKGLRVVDGSIMPQINHGNTHATCIMIGEAGAKFIKEDNNT